MTNKIKFLPLVLLLCVIACTQAPDNGRAATTYLAAQTAGASNPDQEDKTLPHSPKTPKRIAPGIINKADAWCFTPAISIDGATMLLVKWSDPNFSRGNASIQKLYRSKRMDGEWTEPVEVPETSGSRVDYPHFSPDGKYFYLSFNKYHPGQYNYPDQSGWDDFDIWRARCDAAGHIDWDSFVPLDYGDINRAKTPDNLRVRYVHNETSPRTDLNGNLYFWSERLDNGIGRRDIFVHREGEGTAVLPKPINSRYNESGVCISRDGSWMIFSSNRPGGYGEEDLYYSEKQAGGGWSTPVNLGRQVNSPGDDYCPQLVDEDRTLLFTSSRAIPGIAPLDSGEGAFNFAIYSMPVNDIKALGI